MVQTRKIGVHQFWCVPTQPLPPSVREWRAAFGAVLRSKRESAGLSQEQLAERAGVDRKLIYRTELAQTSPRLDAVLQIALALDVPIRDLMPSAR